MAVRLGQTQRPVILHTGAVDVLHHQVIDTVDGNDIFHGIVKTGDVVTAVQFAEQVVIGVVIALR